MNRHEAKALMSHDDLFTTYKAIAKSHLIASISYMEEGEPFEAYREFGSYMAIASAYTAMTGAHTLTYGKAECDPDVQTLISNLCATNYYGIPFFELDGDTYLAFIIERGETYVELPN